GRIAHAQPVSHARAEVLDDDIGPGGQQLHELRAFGRRKVDADVALAHVLLVIVAGVAADDGAPGAGYIARRWLDLYDVGSQVGHHAGRERPGKHAGEVEHTQVAEGIVHGRPW